MSAVKELVEELRTMLVADEMSAGNVEAICERVEYGMGVIAGKGVRVDRELFFAVCGMAADEIIKPIRRLPEPGRRLRAGVTETARASYARSRGSV